LIDPELVESEPTYPVRFNVELFIIHPTMSVTEITLGTRLIPNTAHLVGQPRMTPKGQAARRSLPGYALAT
jgi:hypothetical protein